MNTIKALFDIANHNICRTEGTMDYDRVTDVIITLAHTLRDTETDESIWYLGEGGELALDDLITGAYWHYSEWHSGIYSKGYAALSALGEVFSPGMSHVEQGNIAYELLGQMAEGEQ